ncbi:sugar-binding transcriptional regulator [Miniphocaeibacter massiliensis]|uniref:sugar-binding transcriptional regulator n=1 Tax=Miniphocaeibacter massiliensis TaxID=2041841 RepID=UPI0013EB6644|nr:sugar-binding domain-containing protein [Miniphocaeibacter massiliensis]
MDEKILDILYPDYKEKFVQRYNILNQINLNKNIGRRKLSSLLNYNERLVRNETEKLFQLDLISIEQVGMNITDKGIDALEGAYDLVYSLNSYNELANKVKHALGLTKVIVSKGSIREESGKMENAKIASNYILNSINNNSILGITGGSTVGLAINSIKTKKSYPNLTIVPVRGSLVGSVTNQANILAVKLAEKLNSKYSNFYLPDDFDLDNLKDLSKLPEVENTLDLINNLDMLIFGIGDANKMASRRKLSDEYKNIIKESGAVAEAFGNYFDIRGNIVLKSKSIGITLEQFRNVKDVIAIAGDDDKEKAIIAISEVRKDMTLIITEECAKKIIKLKDSDI